MALPTGAVGWFVVFSDHTHLLFFQLCVCKIYNYLDIFPFLIRLCSHIMKGTLLFRMLDTYTVIDVTMRDRSKINLFCI